MKLNWDIPANKPMQTDGRFAAAADRQGVIRFIIYFILTGLISDPVDYGRL